MTPLDPAVVVDFPLRGAWAATSTPAERVPSHGTDAYGQRYAFDFVRFGPDWDLPYAPRTFWRHLFWAAPAPAFLCWDEPVLSAFDGVVVRALDGRPDRLRVNLAWELFRGALPPPAHGPDDLGPLAGNFVLIQGDEGVGLYAHLRSGSVRVREGERVRAGQRIGAVGNSGDSTMPHLHFHLMDRVDFATAAGVPCAFRDYEREGRDGWERVARGVPGPLERVRCVAPDTA